MTTLTIIACILGALVLALLFAAAFIATLVHQEEKMFQLETGRADMYVSAEEYEEAGGR
jgi:uncharacterized membrane protein YqhA